MFKSKKFSSPNNVGQTLKDARYKTGLSLKMVAKHININKDYLAALENDEWHKLPGEIYAKNFLKIYIDFLEIDPHKIKIDFSKIYCFKYKNYTEDFRPKTRRSDFLNLPKLLVTLLIVLIILASLIYFLWQINQILKPPAIILYHPLTDLTLHDNKLVITGKTDPGVNLKINNEDTLLDSQGQFLQTLNLQTGLNIIHFAGKKKYSKTQILERKIIVE